MAEKSYWQLYRRLRSNVKEHLTFIYSDQPDTSSNDEINSVDVNNRVAVTHDEGREILDNSNHEIINCEDVSNTGLENGGNVHNQEIIESFTDDPEISDTSSIDFHDDELDAQFDISDSSDNDSETGEVIFDLRDDLCAWVSQFNISGSALLVLLAILHPYHPFLPKDPRTLLKTRKNYDVISIGGGLYHHFGIATTLLSEIKSSSPVAVQEISSVSFQINIDGLPLFKSSSTQFWPILGRLIEPYQSKPFTIGLFVGDKKPTNIQEFLQSFIDEMTVLHHTGIQVPGIDHSIQIKISCVICDTPARCFVKQSKGHAGYFGCDKCCQRGQYNNKMTFPETNAVLRTDLQFNEMENEEHHIGISPFRAVPFPLGMVSQFPIDYMHLVCLDVMKRLLWLWMKGPLLCRQGTKFTAHISELLIDMRSYLPR